MKLIHSSDLRLGAPFPHAYPRAEELRSARFATLQQILARARNEKASAILLAGNTLADNRLSERELKHLGSILKASPVPIYLLPGLTDPYTVDSPYRTRPDFFGPPVHVLGESTPLRGEGFTLFPFPVRSRRERPTICVPERTEEDGLRIGVACCENCADPVELDYLALGGRVQHEQRQRSAWSGSPEALDYGHGRGRAFSVTLEGGSPPEIKSLFAGRFHWLESKLSLKSADRVREELEAVKEPSVVLQRLVLQGQLTLPEVRDILELLGQFRAKFFHLEVVDDLTLAPRQEELFQEPLLRTLVRGLSGEEHARCALLELYALAGE
ncbi:MAG: hypothetical protein AB1758_21260 [Candidatus Eremiobacterota bacterium]